MALGLQFEGAHVGTVAPRSGEGAPGNGSSPPPPFARDAVGTMDPEESIIEETGVQLLLRLERRGRVAELEPSLFVPKHFVAGNVVQISGTANTGKSELLLHMVRKCILPIKWNDHPCGGLEVKVVYLDNDRHLHLPRLIGLLEAHFNACQSADGASQQPVTSQDVHAFVQDCLTRLFLINGCTDSGQFVLTLQYIKSFMSTLKCSCSLLIVDSISAFYYEDRMRLLDSLSRLEAHYQLIEALLRGLSVQDGFTILFTRQDLMNSKDFNFLGNGLDELVSWKIKLSRESGSSGCTRVEVRLKGNRWQNCFDVFEDGIRFENNTL